MQAAGPAAIEEDASQKSSAQRYTCPFPGCTRSFRDFWRLKVHYRAPPSARGSGVERGHGQELPFCPLCSLDLRDVKYHKCAAGPAGGATRPRSSSNGTSRAVPPSHYMLPRPGMPHGPMMLPTGNLPTAVAGGHYSSQPVIGMSRVGHLQQQAHPPVAYPPVATAQPASVAGQQQLPVAGQPLAVTPRAAVGAIGGQPFCQPPQHQQQQQVGLQGVAASAMGPGQQQLQQQQQQWWTTGPPSPPPLPQLPWSTQQHPQQQHMLHQQQHNSVQLPQQPSCFQQQQEQPSIPQRCLQYSQAPVQQYLHQQPQPQPVPGRMLPRQSSSGSVLPGPPSGLVQPEHQQQHMPQLADLASAPSYMQQPQHHDHLAVSPCAAMAATHGPHLFGPAGGHQGSSSGSNWPPAAAQGAPGVAVSLSNQQRRASLTTSGSGCNTINNSSGSMVLTGQRLAYSSSLGRFDPMQSSSSALTCHPVTLGGVPCPEVGAAAAGAAAAACAASTTAPPAAVGTGAAMTVGSPDSQLLEQIVEHFRTSLACLRAEITNSCKSTLDQHTAEQRPAADGTDGTADDDGSGAGSPTPVPDANGVSASSCSSSPTRNPAASAATAAGGGGLLLDPQASGLDSTAPAAALGHASAAAAGLPDSLVGLKRVLSVAQAAGSDIPGASQDLPQCKRQVTAEASGKPVASSAPSSMPVEPVAGAAAGGGLSGPTALERQASSMRPGSAMAGRAAWTDTPPPPEAPEALLQLAAHVESETANLQPPGRRSQVPPGGCSHSSNPVDQQQQQQPPPACPQAQQQADGQQNSTAVHAAKVSALIDTALTTAEQWGVKDPPRGLMPRLLEVLNEHIAALSEIHEAELTPEGGLTALPAGGGSHAGADDQDVEASTGDGEAAPVAGMVLPATAEALAQHQVSTAAVSTGLQAEAALPLGQQQLQQQQQGFLSQQFFDHIDRHYLEQQQHFDTGPGPTAVPVMRSTAAAVAIGSHAILPALPTAAVAADS